MRSLRLLPLAAALCAVLSGPALAQPSSQSTGTTSAAAATRPSATDRTFVQKAEEGGQREIAFSRLALERGASDDVKRYAQRMIDDHTRAGDELKQIATSEGIAPPADAKAKAESQARSKMQRLSGAAFDRRYMQTMHDDHVKTVRLFETQAKNGRSEALKGFAAKTLPTLQEHTQQVAALHGSR